MRVQANATIRLIKKLLNHPTYIFKLCACCRVAAALRITNAADSDLINGAGKGDGSFAAATIGIGIAAPSNASARVLHYPQERPDVGRTYRPPAGQIWVRGFQNAPTREERLRQDFQLDGSTED
jgi:hypothetical protein